MKKETEEFIDGMSPEELKQFIQDNWDWEEDEESSSSSIDFKSSTQQLTLPKEAVWAAGAAGLAIVVTAWPALILGVIVGGLLVGKMGCQIFKK